MRVDHFSGSDHVQTAAELDSVLSKRGDQDRNGFWLSFEKDYPMLAVLVRGPVAMVNYLPGPGDPGYVSNNRGPAAETVVFYARPTEECVVTGQVAVPIQSAVAAAHEFFSTRQRPTVIEWMEL